MDMLDYPYRRRKSKVIGLKLKGESTCCTNKRKPKTPLCASDSGSKIQRAVSADTLSTDEARGPVGACKRPGLKVFTHCKYKPKSSTTTPRPPERAFGNLSSTSTDFMGMVRAIKRRRPCKNKGRRKFAPLVRPPPPVTPPWPEPPDHEELSQRMKDSFQCVSRRPTHFNVSDFRLPGDESFVAGRPKSRMGYCPPGEKRHSSDEADDDIIRMRKRNFKFLLTQDPRKFFCLINPVLLRKKPLNERQEYAYLNRLVRNARNICRGAAADDASSTASSSHICEVIDLENPLQLDFQGMDYKTTYQKDEQDIRNQRVYNRICRYMERGRVKEEVMHQVERELQEERIRLPDVYTISNREEQPVITVKKQRVPFGQIFRAPDKPYNKETLEAERKRRKERYRALYEHKKEQQEKARQINEEKQKYDKLMKGMTLANKNVDAKFDYIENRIELSMQTDTKPLPTHRPRRVFPHTTKDALVFRKNLKNRLRLDRNRAIEKGKLFHERTGKTHVYPLANLDISSDEAERESASAATSYESSDDQDGMEVGKAGNKFMVRGFHNKMTEDVRGKWTERQNVGGGKLIVEPAPKVVTTRDDWLESLVPNREDVKIDVVRGIQNITDPDNPRLVLFKRVTGPIELRTKGSPVKKFIKKPLGRHYDRVRLKDLKIVKPKLFYTLKKFNLIRYLFGDPKAPTTRTHHVLGETTFEKLPTAREHLTKMMAEEKDRKEKQQKRRLEIMGIPCIDESDEELKPPCDRKKVKEDLDFVPKPDPDILSDQEAENELEHKLKRFNLPMRFRGNMPAPLHREATLRQHPRRPRGYFLERVPSKLFPNAMDATGAPIMRKLPDDSIAFENVRQVSKAYGNLFNMRHHHDHWDPTQKRQVNVQYQPRLADVKITDPNENMPRKKVRNPPVKANPARKEFVDRDLALPYCNYPKMIKEKQLFKERLERKKSGQSKRGVGDKSKCKGRDTVVHTLKPEERTMDDYPGHREYLKLLYELRNNVSRLEKGKHAKSNDGGPKYDEEYEKKLAQELNQDLDSIESCLTSLSSSQCTNLTNDSGSFLLIEKKRKVPLDYVRKSVVPFEETNRTRFQFKQIDKLAEEQNPFSTLPHVGQRKAQIKLTAAKDGFFTFNTRLRNGARLNLEVPLPEFHERWIGKRRKHHPLMAVDVDENYVSEMRRRPPVKLFPNRGCREVLKEALRIKFETMLVQGEIVRNKIRERLNAFHYNRMLQMKTLYEKLFAKWEKREYDTSMMKVYRVKSYYDATDLLRREWHAVDFKLTRLNMDIVYLEADFIRRIMLQNFHYLMADMDWRREHDWIHRVDPNGEEMEDFVVSIKKRPYVNCRLRDKDDAWAIKHWFDNVHVHNTHPLLVVFPNIKKFISGVNTLRSKTYVMLLELHFTLQLHSELSGQLQFFSIFCKRSLRERHDDVVRKCSRKNFMQDRSVKLERLTNRFLQQPLWEAFDDDQFNRDVAVLTEVWRAVVPPNIRGASERVLEPCDMVAMMADVLMDMLDKFEVWPPYKARRREATVRTRRIYDMKMSYKAYLAEKRIEQEMRNVHRNIEPPFVKPPRAPKLVSYLKPKLPKIESPKEQIISEATRFFYRAFHDEDADLDRDDEEGARASLTVMDTIQEQIIVPFYFDYFLKLNGYTPNYNFRTTADLRDGPELARLGVRSVVPEIMWKMERWETMRKKVMEENIARNPKMYENLS